MPAAERGNGTGAFPPETVDCKHCMSAARPLGSGLYLCGFCRRLTGLRGLR